MSGYFDSLNRRARTTPLAQAPAVVRPPTPPVRRLTPGETPSEYAALREKLLVTANGKPFKTLVFSGCDGGEGCTQVVREFAEMLASSGLSVLLVDADLYAGSLTATVGTGGANLAESVSTGRRPAATSWGKGKLTIVPSPASAADKEHFFRSPEFAAWLDTQRAAYDYVLLDAPPLLKFADGTLIGRLCDALIIVAKAEATQRESLARVRDQLQRAGVNLVGAILTRDHDAIPAILRPYVSAE